MEVDGRGSEARATGWAMSVDAGGDDRKQFSLARLFLACMVAGGIQYGWALQLSLLTPYSQTLGISHTLASLLWLCGPIAGFVVQPIVGYYSDRCTAMIGRRRPFIFVGCILICAAVMMIGFSSDIGRRFGDTKEHCSTYTGPRWAAAIVYVAGFWVLGFANNTVQGPARALMADLSVGYHGPSVGNAIFSLWMALGNILGYSAGANGKWHEWFPSLKTEACCDVCANLKGSFIVAVVLLLICMTVTMFLATENPIDKGTTIDNSSGGCSVFTDLFKSFKNLPPGMLKVLIVTAVTWLSWFPFILYNTDWMGREIYHGDPKGNAVQAKNFDAGVREGAFGLLLSSVFLGITSCMIPRLCRKLTSKVVWSISNLMLFLFMVIMVALSLVSMKGYHPGLYVSLNGPNPTIKGLAVTVFAFIGIPQAVLYSVPWAITSEIVAEEGGGQGLTIGVLNIAIVVPQVVISLIAGPIDGYFNKGNTPAFGLAGAFAFICAILSAILFPNLRGISNAVVATGGH